MKYYTWRDKPQQYNSSVELNFALKVFNQNILSKCFSHLMETGIKMAATASISISDKYMKYAGQK
jgi:hypothetical protein